MNTSKKRVIENIPIDVTVRLVNGTLEQGRIVGKKLDFPIVTYSDGQFQISWVLAERVLDKQVTTIGC
jgi:hypothetical protein